MLTTRLRIGLFTFGLLILAIAPPFVLIPVTKLAVNDALGYMGAIMGTLLAVLGAVSLEDRKRRQDSDDRIEALTGPLWDARLVLGPDPNADAVFDYKRTAEFLEQIESYEKLTALFPAKRTKIILLNAELRDAADYLRSDAWRHALSVMVAYPNDVPPRNEVTERISKLKRLIGDLVAAIKASR